MNKLKTLWQKRRSYTLYWFVAYIAASIDFGLLIWGISLMGDKAGLYFTGSALVSLLLFCLWMLAKEIARGYR